MLTLRQPGRTLTARASFAFGFLPTTGHTAERARRNLGPTAEQREESRSAGRFGDVGRPQPVDEPVPLAEGLGAADVAVQCFAVYVPNKDKHDQEIGTQRRWVLDAIRLLSAINGGATGIPVEGGWVNEEGQIILEHPVIVYSFVTRPDELIKGRKRDIVVYVT